MASVNELRHNETNKAACAPCKDYNQTGLMTIISLGICPICSESLLWARRVAKDPSYLHADNEDLDQPGQMPRLI